MNADPQCSRVAKRCRMGSTVQRWTWNWSWGRPEKEEPGGRSAYGVAHEASNRGHGFCCMRSGMKPVKSTHGTEYTDQSTSKKAPDSKIRVILSKFSETIGAGEEHESFDSIPLKLSWNAASTMLY